MKAIQRHPVRRSVTHVDFLVVNLNEEITVDVPIVLEGEAKAVLSEGGLVEQTLMVLAVSTTPRNIPNEFIVDVSDLEIGDAVRVADLALPSGVTTAARPRHPRGDGPGHPRRRRRGGRGGRGGRRRRGRGRGADAEGGDSSE